MVPNTIAHGVQDFDVRFDCGRICSTYSFIESREAKPDSSITKKTSISALGDPLLTEQIPLSFIEVIGGTVEHLIWSN